LRDELVAIGKTIDGIGHGFLMDCVYEIKSQIEGEDDGHDGHWSDHPQILEYRQRLDEVLSFLCKWGPNSDAAKQHERDRR
jgi:hypothetical protein